MPFKRKSHKTWPPCVYENNGTVIYRPRVPKKNRDKIATTKSGFLSPPRILGKATDSYATIMRRYLAAFEEIVNLADRDKGTVQWLVNKYMSSTKFSSRAITTQKDYAAKLNKLLAFETKVKGANGKYMTVAKWPLEVITRPKIRNLMDEMLADYEAKGMNGRSTVNGQIRVLSAVLKYGLQHYEPETIGLLSNPCNGIEMFTENKRERYVKNEDYELQWNYAIMHGADYLYIVFELAYLLASRSVEVGDLLIDNAIKEGIKVERRKGSKTNIISWTPRLRLAYEKAIELQKTRKKNSKYLITTASGQQLTMSALKSAMARLKKKMVADGYGDIFWTMHDLKHKGITDAKNHCCPVKLF